MRFRDEKSGGYQLHLSHLATPEAAFAPDPHRVLDHPLPDQPWGRSRECREESLRGSSLGSSSLISEHRVAVATAAASACMAGLCIVLYLQRTGFPIPKAGEHARSPCSTDNPDEPADICYSARMVASSENATRSSQTRSGDVAVRARPQLRSYGQMGRFDRAQPAQMGQAVRQSWSGRARRLAPSWPHSRFLTRSSPQHS